jgi:hypothetical protein
MIIQTKLSSEQTCPVFKKEQSFQISIRSTLYDLIFYMEISVKSLSRSYSKKEEIERGERKIFFLKKKSHLISIQNEVSGKMWIS